MLKALLILVSIVLAGSALEISNPMCDACHMIVNKIQKSVP
jgi:hypothetical protein